VVADALSRRHTLFCSLGAQILGFDNIRDLYALDEHFSPIYESCGKKAQDGLGPVTRTMSKRLQEDWARAAKEGPRVLMNLRVDF